MKYRVIYKKWSEVSKNFTLVEEDIMAATFDVKDGNLVFYADQERTLAMMAVPMTAWAGVEPAPEDEPKSALTIVR